MRLTNKILSCSAVIMAFGFMSSAYADSPEYGNYRMCGSNCTTMKAIYGAVNSGLANRPFEAHRDLMERYHPTCGIGQGTPACTACHSLENTVSATGAPGCRTCHGKEWEDRGACTTPTTMPGTTTTTMGGGGGGTLNPATWNTACAGCHTAIQSNMCSATFTAAKRQTMSANTGGAVTVAQIDAAVAASCGGTGTTTTTMMGTTTTTKSVTTTTKRCSRYDRRCRGGYHSRDDD